MYSILFHLEFIVIYWRLISPIWQDSISWGFYFRDFNEQTWIRKKGIKFRDSSDLNFILFLRSHSNWFQGSIDYLHSHMVDLKSPSLYASN